MFSFGDELNRERESRGIRLAQIAETTKGRSAFSGGESNPVASTLYPAASISDPTSRPMHDI